MPSTFGELLRQSRKQRGLSLADLAAATYTSRGHIANLEAGRRPASGEIAVAVDIALDSGGTLVAAHAAEERDRQQQAATRRTLAASLAASRELAGLADLDLDALQDGVEETAIDYLAMPPGPMLHRAHTMRDDIVTRLRDHRHSPAERSDLLVAAGRLSGVLAYAALDLGDDAAALEHTHAASRCASSARDTELMLWTRGTQSLIARFQGDYGRALAFVDDGLQHASTGVPGTGAARLLSGRAQCLANLGDSRGANKALDEAEHAHESVSRKDGAGGLFTFSETKRRYYAGSSLIWPGGEGDAARAEREALGAIHEWESMHADERSLDDERLAHIYVATARVQQRDVDGATEIMRPILALPEQDRISWIMKRAARVGSLLAAPTFRGSTTAAQLRADIEALSVTT